MLYFGVVCPEPHKLTYVMWANSYHAQKKNDRLVFPGLYQGHFNEEEWPEQWVSKTDWKEGNRRAWNSSRDSAILSLCTHLSDQSISYSLVAKHTFSLPFCRQHTHTLSLFLSQIIFFVLMYYDDFILRNKSNLFSKSSLLDYNPRY